MIYIGSPETISNAIERSYPGAQDAVMRARDLTSRQPHDDSVINYQAAALYAICTAYNQAGANILEIGTYYGFTAAVIAQAAPAAQIVSLNPLQWECDAARKVLAGFKNIRIDCIPSQDYLSNYQGPELDMVFVDGNHKAIRGDLPFWNWLTVGGTILFHDYTPKESPRACPPVVRGLNHFCEVLGRDADHRFVDDVFIGMLAWVRHEGDKDYAA